ncbi:MAG: hypothetical protein L6R39_000377 [Caloplaca ligustica]|nr:MAG: hypothetical protein L6R39_000377 [Caloplaca ligustica]
MVRLAGSDNPHNRTPCHHHQILSFRKNCRAIVRTQGHHRVNIPKHISSHHVKHLGLSTGAKTAIGVGVAVSILLIILAVTSFFFWRRNRKNKRAAAAAADKGSGYSENAQSNHQAGGVNGFYNPEVDGNPVSQLHADDARHELGVKRCTSWAIRGGSRRNWARPTDPRSLVVDDRR